MAREYMAIPSGSPWVALTALTNPGVLTALTNPGVLTALTNPCTY